MLEDKRVSDSAIETSKTTATDSAAQHVRAGIACCGWSAEEAMEVSPQNPMALIHVPTPGDHYSASTGSAIVTIAYEINRVHAAHGGVAKVVLSRGSRHDYPVGECIEATPTRPPKGWRKGVDVLGARVGVGRVFGRAAYEPLVRVVPRDVTATILVHNNPIPVPMFHRRLPEARVCLWANNELWTTYSDAEVNRVAASADRLICCSQFIADGTLRRLHTDHHSKVRVVRNGVDVQRFRPMAQTHQVTPTITFIGRVIPEKGADLVLRAAALLERSLGDYQIRIVGSSGFSSRGRLSKYERSLREWAKPLGERVVFVPFRDRAAVMEEYAKASIFCVPSNWDDPCPLTVLEGMACGLPVVASRRGGIPEECGDAALLFDPSDVQTLADALTQLLRDERARVELGRRARERSLLFSWERQYDVLMQAIGGDRA